MTSSISPNSEYLYNAAKSLAIARDVLSQLSPPVPDPGFDQCPATINTVLRRMQLLLTLVQRRQCNQLLLLGDDDLLSIGLFAAHFAGRITVADLDKRILNLISDATGGAVITIETDFRVGLPSHLCSAFDVVFTDPPYTLAGQLLFASCALRALRRSESAHVFICGSDFYLQSKDLTTIESYFRSAGFLMRYCFKDFNEYLAPEDVKRDMAHAGNSAMNTFFSSMRWFKRMDVKSVPDLPLGTTNDIYHYGDIYGAS